MISLRTLAIAAVLAAVLGFAAAWRVQDWRQGSAEADRLEQLREIGQENQRQANRAASLHEQDRARVQERIQIVRQEVARVVEKPVYRNVCLDDDGLRIIRDAIAADQPATAESGPAVPQPAAAR